MTISEQLRDPERELSVDAFDAAADFDGERFYFSWPTTQGRTFLLIVAEALE